MKGFVKVQLKVKSPSMGITASLWLADRQGWIDAYARDYFFTGATDYAFALAIIGSDKNELQKQSNDEDDKREVTEL